MRAEGLAAIEEFAYRFAQRQHASNALYTEVRYCPHLCLEDPNPNPSPNPNP